MNRMGYVISLNVCIRKKNYGFFLYIYLLRNLQYYRFTSHVNQKKERKKKKILPQWASDFSFIVSRNRIVIESIVIEIGNYLWTQTKDRPNLQYLWWCFFSYIPVKMLYRANG